MKRWIALILTFAILLPMVPVFTFPEVYAADADLNEPTLEPSFGVDDDWDDGENEPPTPGPAQSLSLRLQDSGDFVVRNTQVRVLIDTVAADARLQYAVALSGTAKASVVTWEDRSFYVKPTTEGSVTVTVKDSVSGLRASYTFFSVNELPKGNVVILNQPVSAHAELNQEVSFEVNALGKNLAYQWQYRTSSEGEWMDATLAGARTETLLVAATGARHGSRYRCVITAVDGQQTITDEAALTVDAPAGIVEHPVSAETMENEQVSFYVQVYGEEITYRWQYRTSSEGDWLDVTLPGADTDCLEVTAELAQSGYQYRCVVTSAIGEQLISEVATLTVKEKLSIQSQPESVTAKTNTTVHFTVAATGEDLSYQWQYRTASGNWTNTTRTGSKTDMLTVSATMARNGYQYRCVITDAEGNQVISDGATLTVIAALVIKSQPQSVSAQLNSTVTFTVDVSGEDLNYQWQWRKSDTASWAATTVSGCKTAVIRVEATAARNGYQYRCVITDNSGNKVTSHGATLTIQQSDLTIERQPASVTAQLGDSVSFTVKASGTGLKYQWQWRNGDKGTWAATTASGNKTATMTVTATEARNGYQYRCIITDGSGNQVTSHGATLTIGKGDLLIESQPASVNAQLGDSVSFTVKASGTGLKYQWQWRNGDKGTWAATTASGNKTATMTVTATEVRNGYQYRCVITDGSGNQVTSSAATLRIGQPGGTAPVIESQPVSVTAQLNDTITFTVKASGSGLTYQWQWRKSDSSSWAATTVTGNKTATISVAATSARNGYQYRCVITDANGNQVASNGATLTVN